MDFHLGRLRDWRTRAGYEPVLYHSARRPIKPAEGLVNPPTDKPLPVMAHRRALNAREKANYGGVYVEYRRVFLMPVELTGEDFQAKPGDSLEDRKGVQHVIQTADLQNYDTQWRLETLALVLAFDLRDTIQIERATIGYDAAGAAVKTFPPAGGFALYANLPARVQLITDEIQDTRGQRSFVGSHVIVVGRQIATSNEDRVNWIDVGGVQRYLDIKAIHDIERIDTLPLIDAELRP